MKKLPWFKMFPGDVDTDENFRLMTFEQRGMYWTLLNHAWLNEGLPAVVDDIRDLCRLSQADFDRIWERVSKCFEIIDGRFRNPRQEKERAEVRNKSEQSASAARKMHERRPSAHASAERPQDFRSADAVPRASESVSDSESGVSLENQEAKAFSIEDAIERLYGAHPNKAGRILAEQALAGAVGFADDQAALVAKIEASHTAWLPEFQRDGGRFCPQLHRWITDQKFLDDPPAPAEEDYDWRKAAMA